MPTEAIPFDFMARMERERRARARPANDPVGEALQGIVSESAAETVRRTPPPDRVARTTRLAREANDSPINVEGREDEVETLLQAQRFGDLAKRYPAIGKFAVFNPRAAAMARDDAQALGKVAGAFDRDALAHSWSISEPVVDPTFGNSVKGVLTSLVQGVEQLRTAGALWIGDYLPNMPWENANTRRITERRLKSEFSIAQSNIDLARPAFQSSTASGVYSGVASFAQMIPALAASIGTRSVAPAMMIAGAQTAVPAYGKYRVRGGSVREATVGALGEGAVEAGFEALPMGTVVAKFGRSTLGKFLGEYLVKEQASEQLTTLAQNAIDTAIANPDKSWGDYWAERPAAAYETFVATLVSTGALGGLQAVANRSAKRDAYRAQAAAEGHLLDTLAAGAAESKLRDRDPQAFRALLDKLSESMVADKLYIPGDAARACMQSEGFEDSDFWRDHAEEIAEAEARGGDIVVPLSEAITHLSDRAAWNALRGDVRLAAGGYSRAEIEALGDEAGAVDNEVAALFQTTTNDPRNRLFTSAYSKLSEAGFSGNAARVQAELLVERYAARRARLGQELDGSELDALEVQQVLPERLKEAAKADATDLVINALRGGKSSTLQDGPSLVEWLASRGGVNDTGGDLAAIGLDRWHRERPFRKKAIRPFDPAAAMGGISGAGDYGLDSTLRDAIAQGYFPELEGHGGTAYGKDTHDVQILVDAISAELAGEPRYAKAAKVDDMRAAAEELRQLLEERGLDADAMSDEEIRGFLTRFEREDRSGRSYASGERGRILFGPDGRATIQLFKSRNLSTFLHEAGHMFLEELRADASREDAPAKLRGDWGAVLDWFAANDAKLENGEIPTKAHELWARGFERYLMEGKAPSDRLAGVFTTLRSWLVGIYRRVRNLDAPVTDEIRAVMDRLLATEEQIAEKRTAQGLEPAFRSAADGAMTGPEFSAYMELVASAKTAANSELLASAIRGLRAQETERYKALEAEVRAEVSKSVDARPEFRALAAIAGSPLNRQWIVDRFGADAPALMPAGVPPTVKDNGAHPDTVAEATGFASGREMVETLMGVEKRRRELRGAGDKRTVRAATIAGETHDAMMARYGDPFATGEIEDEALAAVHNDLQGEVLSAEVRALARRVGKRPTPYSLAREWAQHKVRSGEVKDHASGAAIQQYRRAGAANAHAAFDALAQGDFEAAFRHKQAQLVNNALVRAARETAREVDAAVKRLDKVARRRTMTGVEQSYLEQAHNLLEEVDLRERSGRQVGRQEAFETWAAARQEEGHTLAVPRSFAATIGKTHWSKLSAENLLGLDDAVRQMLHLGRLKQTLRDRQEERALDQVVSEARTTMERLPMREAKSFEDPTVVDRMKSGAMGITASLLKMETVFRRLDGSGHGAFNRTVFHPIREAQAEEQRLMREVLDELDRHLKALPKDIVASWHDQYVSEKLFDPRTHQPIKGPRSKLISMALNMGNESNAAKLAGGYGWREQEVLQELDRELAPEEWQYVQKVWDTIEKLWPRIVSLEKRVNGIAPDKVRARRLNTSAGILRGGYFPVVYDPERSRTADQHAGKAEGRLFENNYTRASTSRGFTKERTEVERPLLLSLEVVNRHVAEVVHDLTHREVVMQADRFLSDRRVLDMVDETLGRDVSGLFRPWLQYIANEWSYDRAGVGKLESFIRGARRNATFVGMAYRFSTMIAQLGGYVNSVERIGPKWMLEGLSVWRRDRKGATAFALERSHELPGRFENLDRDIRENARRFAGKTDTASLVRRYGFSAIASFDKMVAVPTWLGAYNKAIAAGLEEAQAVHEADSAVNESQGGGAAKDMAAIQRGRGTAGELGKALTMFYSFQSAKFNRYVELAWDAGDAWRARKPSMTPELASRAAMLTLVEPVLGAILTGGGPDDDREEGWTEWVLKQSVYALVAPVPLARDIVPAATKKAAGDRSYGYRFTPMQGAGDALVRVAGDARKLAQGEETKNATRNLLEATGYLTGVVPGQAAASAQFFVDVISGAAEPASASDWWQGVTKGRIEAD